MAERRVVALRMTWALLLAFFIAFAGEARAATWYVREGGTGDGSSWNRPSSNLTAVLTNAAAGDAVWVAGGTYSPGSAPADTFPLKKGVKVYGGFAGGETSLEARDWTNNVTTLDGGGVNRHVVTGGTGAARDDTRLDGFTVTRGHAAGVWPDHSGGGMYNNNSSPTVANCTFKDNTADNNGGGMFNTSRANPVVTHCTFLGNRAVKDNEGKGGGMHNDGSSPTVAHCAFTGNTAANNGGGMFNTGNANPLVTHCIFVGNKAIRDADKGDGGGMYNNGSSPTVANCTFAANTAGYSCGGMYNNKSSPVVTNCTFAGNRAENQNGGGMYNNGSSPAVTNCTFTGNTAKNNGGGMLNRNRASPVVTNAIFWGNAATSGPELFNDRVDSHLANCLIDTRGIEQYFNGTVTSQDLISGDPKLVSCDAAGTASPTIGFADVAFYALGPGSPALDRGLGTGLQTVSGRAVTVPDRDRRGVFRPQYGGVDVGAYERTRPEPWTIAASAAFGGSIAPGGNVSVTQGMDRTFTITPDPGYTIRDVSVDGVSVGTPASYTFTAVSGDHVIRATFAAPDTPPAPSPSSRAITAEAGAGGSISPSGTVWVAYGGTQMFTIAPNGGYAIRDVTVDGVSMGTPAAYTFSNVTADHTIRAAFVAVGVPGVPDGPDAPGLPLLPDPPDAPRSQSGGGGCDAGWVGAVLAVAVLFPSKHGR